MRTRLLLLLPLLGACATSSTVDSSADTSRRDDTAMADATDVDAGDTSTQPDTACAVGEMRCDGECVSPSSDPQHCGVCNNQCPADWLCSDGFCVSGCEAPTTNCEGTCVNLDSHRDHCGGCGLACADGESCLDGACVLDCGALAECDGACVNTSNDTAHCGVCGNACAVTQICNAGRCQCPSGQLACGGACVDTQSDDAHCGGCDIACGDDARCEAGACECQGDALRCDGVCTDVSDDPMHCGDCGVACGTLQVCVAGACADDCPDGLSVCGDTCVDRETSTAHCGTCDNACRDDQVCDAGSCACDAGEEECDGVCSDLSRSTDHCGSCGVACGPTQSCVGGLCTCAAGETACGDDCFDTERDPLHCGDCTTACDADRTCVEGACTCPAGSEDCGGTCTPTDSDPNNCGGCGITCGASEVCHAGACAATCPGDLDACDGACVDLASDADHCGACDVTCADGVTCEAGACACAPDLLEPNDTEATRYTIPVGSFPYEPVREGVLSRLTLCGGDADLFEVLMPGSRSNVTITTEGDCADGSLDLTMVLTDDGGATIATASSPASGGCPTLAASAGSGIYTLAIASEGGTEGTYGLGVDYGPAMEWEVNDTRDAADGPFMVSGVGQGSIYDEAFSNDTDYWVFGLSYRSGVSIETTGSSGSGCDGDHVIALYDENGGLLQSNDDGGTGLCSLIDGYYLDPGIYYVSVEFYNDTLLSDDGFDYQIHFDLPYNVELEPNDLPIVADDFGFPFSAFGGIHTPGDVDTYALSLASATAVDVYAGGVVLGCEADLAIRVLASDGAVIAETSDGITNGRDAGACPLLLAEDVAALNPLPAGDYTIEVTGDGDAMGPYIVNALRP